MYIIENANILKDKQINVSSLIINEDRIAKFEASTRHYKLMKMNAEDYIMTPTYVLFNTEILQKHIFQDLKNYLLEKFLMKGSTIIFTYANVSFEKELAKKIYELKTNLISSPLDFIIGVRIPVRLLTPSFVRNCKKQQVPAIFVELESLKELENIPWGWIREAQFPFNCPLIPIISSSQKKEEKVALSKWKGIMVKEKIYSIFSELVENHPLPVAVLNKVGLFPQKACLMHGSELSYNLYLKEREIKNVDEASLFHYHSDRLIVTVHRGKVVRSGKTCFFKPGNGEHVKVRTPSYFSL